MLVTFARLTFFCFASLYCFAFSGCSKQEVPQNGLRIGAIASLTGPAGEQGKNWLRGAQLAISDAQAKGIRVELLSEDDQTEPAKVVSAFTKLSQVNHVQGIIGGTWDYLGEAAYPLARRFKVPFITPTNPPEVLSVEALGNPYVFSNGMTLEAIKSSLQTFLQREPVKSLGIIYPNLPFGTQQAALVEGLAHDAGIPVVYRYEFPVSATTSDNMRLASIKLNETKPDVTYAVLDYNGIDLLTTEFAKMRYFPKMLTTQHLDQAFAFSKDPSRYRSMYAIYPKVLEGDFARRFQERFGESPKVFAENGYDAAMFLIELLSKGVDYTSTTASFEYPGLTGVHRLPVNKGALVKNEGVLMTTKDGSFAQLE